MLDSKKTRYLLIGIVFSALISCASYFFTQNFSHPFLSSFEYIFFDYKQNIFLNELSQESEITVVEIDESTLIEMGRWPWERKLTAKLIEKTINAGAKKVILDIVFSENSNIENDSALKNTIEKYKDKIVLGGYVNSYSLSSSDVEKKCLQDFIFTKKNSKTTSGWSKSDHYTSTYNSVFDVEYKNILEKYLADKNKDSIFELSDSELFYLTIMHGRAVGSYCASLNSSQKFTFFKKNVPSNIILNIDLIQDVALYTGVFSVLPDSDGSIRRYFLKYHLADLSIPTSAAAGLDVSDINEFWINYGQKIPKKIEAAKILKDEVTDLTNQIVVIGVTAPGVYDIRKTPISEAFPGTYIQAQALSNIKNKQYLLYWVPAYFLLFLMILTLSVLLIYRKKIKWKTSVLIFVSTLVLVILLELYLFNKNLFFWSFEFYFLWAIMFILNNYLYYKDEYTQKNFIKLLFSKYVSENIVQDILNSPEKINLSGEKKMLSVFFSDIRNFTSLSEKLDPLIVSQVLNVYFDPMVETIKMNDGTVDKFIGDGMLAFFGAPIESKNNARNACLSAIECINSLQMINEKIKPLVDDKINIGIGLNLQEVFVGNIGASGLQSYTVIGDGVNLAARLQALTKKYGVRIITSQSIYQRCSEEFIFKKLDQVKVKGREEPIWIYELRSNATQREKENILAYEQIIECFFSKDLVEARKKIDAYILENEQDLSISIINARLSQIEANPVLNWDIYRYGSS